MRARMAVRGAVGPQMHANASHGSGVAGEMKWRSVCVSELALVKGRSPVLGDWVLDDEYSVQIRRLCLSSQRKKKKTRKALLHLPFPMSK